MAVNYEVDGSASVTGEPKGRPGRHFTERARAALAELRRHARENPVVRETVGVFVTRITGGNLFGWEIRQFGGVVLDRGEGSFATPAAAHAAGERALADRTSASTDADSP